MQAQTRTMAAAGPRLSTATRSQTGDPARAGAGGSPSSAAVVALAAGAATLLATRQLLVNGALDAARDGPRGGVGADVGALHARPRATRPAQLAGDPASGDVPARDARRAAPRRRRAAIAAPTKRPAPRPPRWLATTAQRHGWTDILLIDDGGSRVAFASGDTPQLVAGQRPRPRSCSAPRAATSPAASPWSTPAPIPPSPAQPMLYAATSVVDGGTRVGTLVVAIGTAQLEAALRASSGQTLPFGARRERLGVAGRRRRAGCARASARPSDRRRAPTAPARTTSPTGALAEALQGSEGAGAYAERRRQRPGRVLAARGRRRALGGRRADARVDRAGAAAPRRR